MVNLETEFTSDKHLYRILRHTISSAYPGDIIHEKWNDDDLTVLVHNAILLAKRCDEVFPPNKDDRYKLKKDPQWSLNMVKYNIYYWEKPPVEIYFDHGDEPVLPIPLEASRDVGYYSDDYNNRPGFLERKIQFAVNRLQEITPTFAIEGLRATGKDSCVRSLQQRLEKREYQIRLAKLTGFLDSPEDWLDYHDSLSPIAQERIAYERQIVEAMQEDDTNNIIILSLRHWMDELGYYPDDKEVFESAFERAEQWLSPHREKPGEWSWNFLQNVYLGHLNDLYEKSKNEIKNGIVVANGGPIARSMFWGYYGWSRELFGDVNTAAAFLLPPQMRRNGNKLALRINLPQITFFLDVPPEELLKRIERDEVRSDEASDRRQSVIDNVEVMKKVFMMFQEAYPDKFILINGNRPTEEVTNEMEAILSQRGLI